MENSSGGLKTRNKIIVIMENLTKINYLQMKE